jgi:hypothetical protein
MDLEVCELGAVSVQASPEVGPAAEPGDRRRSGKATFLVSALVLLVVLLARNAYLFTSPVHEDGDFALNSLLVQRALHFQLLEGNYSRVGFHHPGPAFLYVLAAGQAVFFGLLHIVPAPYNGQVVGDLCFTAAIVGWIVLIVERVTGSRLAAAATFAVILLFAANHGMFANMWFPYLYVPVFALLLVSGAALAGGRTGELPAFVVAGGFLVHGHVSFVMFVAVTALAAGGGWGILRRRDWREQLRAHRRRIRLSLGVVGLFVLPLVLQTALDYPGPWPKYLHYTTLHEAGSGPVSDALRFFSWYWSSAQQPVALTCGAALAGAVLLATDRVPTRRAYFLGLYGLLALESVLFAGYLIRGVDRLIPLNRYIGFFYLTVPLLLVVAAAAQLAARGRDLGRLGPLRWIFGGAHDAQTPTGGVVVVADTTPVSDSSSALPDQRLDRRGHPPRPTGQALMPVVVATGTVLVFVLGATRPGLQNPYRGAAYPDAVSALASDPHRGRRPVAVHFPRDSWPVVAGVVVEASRRQLPICLADPQPRWINLFTARYVCQGQAPRWHVHIVRGNQGPVGALVVWQGPETVISQQPDPSRGMAAFHR